MAKFTADHQLNRLLKEAPPLPGEAYQPHRGDRIFVNRDLDLSQIEAVGFDMDYTLAEYQREALDRLAMKLALKVMVERNGYPESILALPFRSGFAIRGLVMDTELGNVLKMDKFHTVSMAYHGLKLLNRKQRAETYGHTRINLDRSRFRSVDTLFEILETYLFAALIDHLGKQTNKPADYQQIFVDLRGAIDLCHSDGSLKREIMSKPDQFIKDDPKLIPALHMLRESGRKLFVLTNSEPHYTDFVLSHLFRDAEPYFSGWRDCFQHVIASACKPGFFREGTPSELIERRPRFSSGGNLARLKKSLRTGGEKVLYVGDHIYGDILKSKRASNWRTCIIVPELHDQIEAESRTRPLLRELRGFESRHKEIDMETVWRRNHLLELRHFQKSKGDALETPSREKLKSRIKRLESELAQLDEELNTVLDHSLVLRRKISATFNPFWGRLFKTGSHLSLFAEQIRDYADIYTSRVSNLGYYNHESSLQSEVAPMPHEDSLSPVRDLDFDISMNGSAPEAKET